MYSAVIVLLQYIWHSYLCNWWDMWEKFFFNEKNVIEMKKKHFEQELLIIFVPQLFLKISNYKK